MSAKPVSQMAWRLHRLRAMSPREVAQRLFRRVAHIFSHPPVSWEGQLAPVELYPHLPDPKNAPEGLRAALKRDRDEIMAGRFTAFRNVPLQVDLPPKWNRDYLAGVDVPQDSSGLNHRSLPNGADVKLIWELSRWYQLVRLAQAAFILDDAQARQTCLRLLTDWLNANPPFRGWNWISGLEGGMRLIQFAWIDALLQESAEGLSRLRAQIVPSHVWFTWREKSFGSSANNHLLGELAGLIIACVRWPQATRWAASLDQLQARWEREVLAQFADDGGNREQALNYHLYSWELSWQTYLALRAAGREVSPVVQARLEKAKAFYVAVQSEGDHWDYGDSDSAFVTPLFASQENAITEWRNWMLDSGRCNALQFWLGSTPLSSARPTTDEWQLFNETGTAVRRDASWFLRFDLSELGYLSTAAHGHCDALHLSVWHNNQAIVIDPGTGAYYQNSEMRNYLASWGAHNGPHFPNADFPERVGPFLWKNHHEKPIVRQSEQHSLTAELVLPGGKITRRVVRMEETSGWRVEDEASEPFSVHWTFSPDGQLFREGPHEFRFVRQEVSLRILLSPDWQSVEVFEPITKHAMTLCSPGFREIRYAPGLLLRSPSGHKPCQLWTAFLPWPTS